MIKYNLICESKHEFESWFSNSKEFEKLKKNNMLACIYCNSGKIEKSIMSPRIVNSNKDYLKVKNKLIEVRRYIENNFEFVGNDFAKEVRDVFYDNKKKKNIYGTTTLEEREQLSEEGIDLISVPWVKKDN